MDKNELNTMTMDDVSATPAWHETVPGAVAGALIMRALSNPATHPLIDDERVRTEIRLRERYAGLDRAALRSTLPLPAYDAYYRRFGQTYHVLLQLESVVLKGKALPRRPPLIEAMFLAELDSLILTAGHDLDKLTLPVFVDVAGPDERYIGIGVREQSCKSGDFLMRDGDGIICSIIQGPDERTKINSTTRNALFVVYAPPGIGEKPVRRHLESIAHNVRLIAPEAKTITLTTIVAG